MDRWEALYAFWASFGVPAYESNSVPDLKEIAFPFISYDAVSAAWDSNALCNASVWTRSSSWAAADALADAIEARIFGGCNIPYDGGTIWITPESPFAQSMGDPDDDRIKRKLLSVVYHFS